MTLDFQKQDVVKWSDYNLADRLSFTILPSVGKFGTRWRDRGSPPSVDHYNIC